MGRSITAKQLKSLAAKLKKAKDEDEKAELLDAVGGEDERGQLAWELVRSKAYDASCDPAFWSILNEGDDHASSRDVFAFVATIPDAALKAFDGELIVHGWPAELDQLAAAAYGKDRAPWDTGHAKLAKLARPGLAMMRARFGGTKPPKGALPRIAKVLLAGKLCDWLWLPRDGERTAVELFESYRPNADFYAYVGVFGTRAEWDRSLLDVALKRLAHDEDVGVGLLAEAAREAERSELVPLLDACGGMDRMPHALAFLDARDDSPADLLWVADRLKDVTTDIGAVCRHTAIVRLAAANKPIPAKLDAKLVGRGWETFAGRTLFAGLERFVGAIAALPAARRRAVLERLLADLQSRARAIPALASEPSLLERGAHAMLEDPQRAQRADEYALAFSRLGVAHLPWLVEQLETAADPGVADLWRRAIFYILRDEWRAGREVTPKYDRLITVTEWSESGYYAGIVGPMRELLRAMPEPRAEAIVLAALDGPAYSRAFMLASTRPTERVLAKALGGFVAHLADMDEHDLVFALRSLGEETARPHLERALAESRGDRKLVEAVAEAFDRTYLASISSFRPPTYGERVAALADAHLGPKTRLYFLERREGPPEEGELSRVGGPALGIPPKKWPSKGKRKLTHVFTLDLAAMPELRTQLGNARALSLFVLDPSLNEASEPDTDWSEVVLLDDEAVARGETGESDSEPRGVDISSADVPTAMFDEQRPPELKELRKLVFQAPCRALGSPMWIQEDEHFGPFALQFDEMFADINLGDSGVMYVFPDTAFWQCY